MSENMKRVVMEGGNLLCGTASGNVNKHGAHTNNSTSYLDFLLMSYLFFIILCGYLLVAFWTNKIKELLSIIATHL
jgi:hypothetical protein